MAKRTPYAGPQALALKQDGAWTYGALVYHLWSYAGNDSRSDLSLTAVQPFLSYTFKKTLTTLGGGSEATYDWPAGQWTVPVAVSIGQMIKIGKQPVKFGLAARSFAEKPDGGPDWGMRFTITLPLLK